MTAKTPAKKRVKLKPKPKPAKKRGKLKAKPAKKKTAPKKRVKKPRKLELAPADLAPTHTVRQQALADFVTDPESRDAGYHFGRLDREYHTLVLLEQFKGWEVHDGWAVKREAYWSEAQRQLLVKTRDNTVHTLAASMHELDELRGFAKEWCDPIRDEEGEVLRYPLTDDKGDPHRYGGKPMLAVRFKDLEGAVKSTLLLDQALQNRRDEILRLTGQGDSASKVVADPVVALVKFTPQELRAMAQELVKHRQPELVTGMIEVEGEPDDG